MRTRWFRWKWIAALVGALLLVYGGLVLTARPAPAHPFFAQVDHRPLIIAHRGGKGLWPEETLYAFEQALDMGVDVIEMDLHSTADGVLVLMHDDTVDRTTNGTGAVQNLTLEEIKALDAGYTWTPDNGATYPSRGQGITVPTLEEIFAAFPDALMNIEIKQMEPPQIARFCAMIHEAGKEEQVLVASFSAEIMETFVQECPDIARAAGRSEVQAFYIMNRLRLGAAFSPSSHVFQVPEYSGNLHILSPALIVGAHRRNLEVHAWTINEAEDMQRILALGVDGIITDYPDRLLELR